MTDQGKANYEGFHAAIPGAKAKPFEELTYTERLAWDGGACSVELYLAELPVDEDAQDEPTTTVVIVTETRPDRFADRHYRASGFKRDARAGLDITRDGRVVASYPPGTWLSVREDDSTVPDTTKRALDVALLALREIGRTNVTERNADGTLHAGVVVLKELASQALEDVEAEI